ncbi:MAG TPA: murein biosynthesis integral membrane protein MurJ [Kofleriaceae bacterium]|nr:murein biosynthesis integral membrane protein MurJ [Kofleriaceae bacterium]
MSQPEAGGGVPGAGEPATGAIDDAGGPRPPRPAPRTTGGHRLIRTAGLLSAATMLSRLLGLVREQLFAALLGASLFAEAFIVAFRIPNLLRDLFAEGALSQAFVPTFKASLKRGGTSAAYLLGNRVAGTLLAVIAILTIVAAAGAPEIVQSMAGTFADTPGKFELAVILTRIMLPFLAMVSLAAVAMGMLNAQDRYATPALAPATFNLVCITIGLTLWGLGLDGRKVAIGWAIGTLLGGAAQLGIQMPTLWRQGWRPRLGVDLMLRDPHVRHVAALMVPAVAGLAAVQVNVFVNTIFATQEAGAAAWLNYAFRFLQLPIGVFGVAIATVTTTRYADAAADGNRARMAEQLAEGLRLVAFLTVPATVGLVVLGEPIIQLIYQHGRFGSADTRATVAALDLYSLGLVAYAAVKVVAPSFYAVGLSRLPMIASVGAVAGNLAINLILHPIYGYKVLALGTAIAATLNFGILYVSFHRRISPVANRALLGHLARVSLAAGVMGAATWGSHAGIAAVLDPRSLTGRLVLALAPVLVGVAVYAACARALRISELEHYLRRFSRRR